MFGRKRRAEAKRQGRIEEWHSALLNHIERAESGEITSTDLGDHDRLWTPALKVFADEVLTIDEQSRWDIVLERLISEEMGGNFVKQLE